MEPFEKGMHNPATTRAWDGSRWIPAFVAGQVSQTVNGGLRPSREIDDEDLEPYTWRECEIIAAFIDDEGSERYRVEFNNGVRMDLLRGDILGGWGESLMHDRPHDLLAQHAIKASESPASLALGM